MAVVARLDDDWHGNQCDYWRRLPPESRLYRHGEGETPQQQHIVKGRAGKSDGIHGETWARLQLSVVAWYLNYRDWLKGGPQVA